MKLNDKKKRLGGAAGVIRFASLGRREGTYVKPVSLVRRLHGDGEDMVSAGWSERSYHGTDADSAAVPAVGRGQHVLLIAAHFAPESTSGTHRSLHFARALKEAGFMVSVVTVNRDSLTVVDEHLNSVFPYEDQILRVPLRPTLETTYLACKKPWTQLVERIRGSSPGEHVRRENEQGRIVRRRNPIRQELSGAISFPDRYRGWYRPAIEAAERLALKAPVHAVFASGPPWTALMAAFAVSQRLHCKLITDFRDPWTWRMGCIDTDRPKLCSTWAERHENRIIARSSAVLFNSPDLLSNSRRNVENLPASVYCILNGTDMPARARVRDFPTSGRLRIRHLGSLYGGRSVAPLLSAIAASDIDPSRITIELIGPADCESALSGGDLSRSEVIRRPVMPHSDAARLMDEPAVLLAVQSRNFSAQIPTKLYEYLRTGNPILVLAAHDSAAWRIASQYERCYRLDFEDTAGNALIMQRLFNRWSGGQLAQVPASDTASFGKARIGREFASLVSTLLKDDPRAGQLLRPPPQSQIWPNPGMVSR